ncbi:hypothetical protein BFP72_11710 [Reichenbachiella sp. 5M10]|uniref:hypothetical protein n=1 Tax=Reichenbachiella sp. 5M10 TaxID=1889772 RepID=UPI000C1567AE|nr:hypothetical protein [Reichenbachiella sp. 5M10]PIB36013.1 hypothetical protein BFP72_11710 [Reichenbachiella sp. 5M10]
MKTKIIALLAIVFALSIQSSYAQSTSEIDMDEYFADLNLTEDQKVTFDEITDEYYANLQHVQETETSKTKMYKAYKTHKKTRDNKMKALMDKEQYSLYQTKQKELEKKAREENRG